MTLEEAGQRILEGNPFINCPKGCGTTRQYADPSSCLDCKDRGSVIDPAYKEACELLGMPLPEYTLGFKVWETIEFGGEHPRRSAIYSWSSDD